MLLPLQTLEDFVEPTDKWKGILKLLLQPWAEGACCSDLRLSELWGLHSQPFSGRLPKLWVNRVASVERWRMLSRSHWGIESSLGVLEQEADD